MIDVALDRLTRGRWDAVWVEIDGDFDGRVERLLQQVNEDVGAGRYRAVVSAVPELIDPVSANVASPDVEVIINAGEAERAAALAMLARPAAAGVRDSASDLSGPRLRQLSDEVTRIAATLAKLSAGTQPPAIAEAAIHASPADAPAVSAEAVRGVIRARRLRADHLPADLFADPAWDMLLDLLQAEIVQHRVPVSSLCNAAAVPATTALRWLKTMTERGVVQRRNDPHDGRRVFIELAKSTSTALRNYFAEAGRLGVI
jgi:DNA-binding MarR family transcriptional regulator